MGTVKQPLSIDSLYEQVRFEYLNFRDSSRESQHIPRLRFRLGQNVFLGQGSYRPYIGIYEEAIVQFPQPSYSQVNFQGARFFAGYGFDFRMSIDVLLGLKAEADVSTSGSTVTLYYGPVFSIEYNFHGLLISENHKRTTAFKDF